jgi:hypothetical protein
MKGDMNETICIACMHLRLADIMHYLYTTYADACRRLHYVLSVRA